MGYSTFTLKRWNPLHLPSTQHLLIKDRVYDIYSLEMDFTSIIHQRWSTQNLLMINGAHCIYSSEMVSTPVTLSRFCTLHLMESTVFSHKRWRTQPLLLRDEFHSIYSWDMVSKIYTNERCTNRIYDTYLLFRDGFHINHSSEMG